MKSIDGSALVQLLQGRHSPPLYGSDNLNRSSFLRKPE
jgi:hypothetical protein